MNTLVRIIAQHGTPYDSLDYHYLNVNLWHCIFIILSYQYFEEKAE